MDGSLRAAILIVSTTAAQDPSADAAGDVLKTVFSAEGDGKWFVQSTQIVSDDVLAIQKQVLAWTDGLEAPNLIITTGGTGFAISDSTPEVSSHKVQRDFPRINGMQAIAPLLHKQAPGLVHGMLASSLAVTPCE